MRWTEFTLLAAMLVGQPLRKFEMPVHALDVVKERPGADDEKQPDILPNEQVGASVFLCLASRERDRISVEVKRERAYSEETGVVDLKQMGELHRLLRLLDGEVRRFSDELAQHSWSPLSCSLFIVNRVARCVRLTLIDNNQETRNDWEHIGTKKECSDPWVRKTKRAAVTESPPP